MIKLIWNKKDKMIYDKDLKMYIHYTEYTEYKNSINFFKNQQYIMNIDKEYIKSD